MKTLTIRFILRYSAVAACAALFASASLPAQAAELWRVNPAKSHVGTGSTTLVLERVTGDAAHADANGASGTGAFIVISRGNVYVAESGGVAGKASPLRAVDYPRWRDMKFVQIGANAHSTDVCSFHCQAGLADDRMTIEFKSNGADMAKYMRNMVAFRE